LRDTFDILAREIPLVDDPTRPPTRVREDASEALLARLKELKRMVIHHGTLRMIKEMATENFVRTSEPSSNHPTETEATAGLDTETDSVEQSNSHIRANSDAASQRTGDFFQPLTPLFFAPELAADGSDFGLLEFPGFLDLDLRYPR
jgi:hypothetical protein